MHAHTHTLEDLRATIPLGARRDTRSAGSNTAGSLQGGQEGSRRVGLPQVSAIKGDNATS